MEVFMHHCYRKLPALMSRTLFKALKRSHIKCAIHTSPSSLSLPNQPSHHRLCLASSSHPTSGRVRREETWHAAARDWCCRQGLSIPPTLAASITYQSLWGPWRSWFGSLMKRCMRSVDRKLTCRHCAVQNSGRRVAAGSLWGKRCSGYWIGTMLNTASGRLMKKQSQSFLLPRRYLTRSCHFCCTRYLHWCFFFLK